MSTPCWRCNHDPLPTSGLDRLSLCDEHLRERVHHTMLHGAGVPTIRGAIARWVEVPASGRAQ